MSAKRIAKQTQDLRKEFEEWHKKAHGWVPKSNPNGDYTSWNVMSQSTYEGFCAGYLQGFEDRDRYGNARKECWRWN